MLQGDLSARVVSGEERKYIIQRWFDALADGRNRAEDGRQEFGSGEKS